MVSGTESAGADFGGFLAWQVMPVMAVNAGAGYPEVGEQKTQGLITQWGSDEFSQIALALNQMLQQFRSTVDQLLHASVQLSAVAEQTAATSRITIRMLYINKTKKPKTWPVLLKN